MALFRSVVTAFPDLETACLRFMPTLTEIVCNLLFSKILMICFG
jgi:hypothetical protein